jgi:predicted metal-dependent peptidase
MFAGVLSVGKVKFTDELPTAATNGRDVMYNPEFIKTLDDKELNYVVLHEALHKVYQHMHLWKKLWKENPMLANMAADYVVNYAIYEADEQSEIAKRPDSALFDLAYKGMTTKQIFDMLKKVVTLLSNNAGHDTHDWEGAEQLSDEEVKETAKQIDQALRQGEIIRGKMQGNKNRSINELLEPKVNWREQLRDFVNCHM